MALRPLRQRAAGAAGCGGNRQPKSAAPGFAPALLHGEHCTLTSLPLLKGKTIQIKASTPSGCARLLLSAPYAIIRHSLNKEGYYPFQ